jgi:tripartite-type tricarboxylate transporter receptor subunit TctC
VRQISTNLGVEPAPTTPEELATRIRVEVQDAHKIAQAAGIKPE